MRNSLENQEVHYALKETSGILIILTSQPCSSQQLTCFLTDAF